MPDSSSDIAGTDAVCAFWSGIGTRLSKISSRNGTDGVFFRAPTASPDTAEEEKKNEEEEKKKRVVMQRVMGRRLETVVVTLLEDVLESP